MFRQKLAMEKSPTNMTQSQHKIYKRPALYMCPKYYTWFPLCKEICNGRATLSFIFQTISGTEIQKNKSIGHSFIKLINDKYL